MFDETSKLIILLDSSRFGGIETHVLELATSLKHQLQLEVVFLNDYGLHPLEAQFIEKHISYRKLDGRWKSLWRFIREERPALIHTHGYKAGLFGKSVAKLAGVPIVCSFHAGEKCHGRLALYDGLDRMSAVLADINYAASQKIAEGVKAEARVLSNFVQSSALTMTYGNQIAFVGRLSEEKSPETFCGLSSRFPDEQFHVYGDGELSSILQRIFCHQENLFFHGFSQMEDYWQHIGLLVITSKFEGLPLCAIEAMARGIPVLSTEVGQLPELIDHGKNGWLVEKHDIQGLRYYLRRWCSLDDSNRNKMKQAALDKVKFHYTEKTACEVILHDYVQVSNLRPACLNGELNGKLNRELNGELR